MAFPKVPLPVTALGATEPALSSSLQAATMSKWVRALGKTRGRSISHSKLCGIRGRVE
jgi:hypothetical protein